MSKKYNSYLISILCHINVQFFESHHRIKFLILPHRQLIHGCTHFLVTDLRLLLYFGIKSGYHLTVLWNVLKKLFVIKSPYKF